MELAIFADHVAINLAQAFGPRHNAIPQKGAKQNAEKTDLHLHGDLRPRQHRDGRVTCSAEEISRDLDRRGWRWLHDNRCQHSQLRLKLISIEPGDEELNRVVVKWSTNPGVNVIATVWHVIKVNGRQALISVNEEAPTSNTLYLKK
jgi:hypothetical protein